MMAVLIKVRGLKKTQQNLKRMPIIVRKALLESIEEAARLIERDIKEGFQKGDPLHTRSGRTVASIHTRIVKSRLSAFVGTPLKHMRIHEEGGTITPKRSRVLTIPLKAAKTGAGKARGSARQVGAAYKHTFWYKKDDWKNPILFGVRATGRLVPLFVGVGRVDIPKREPFRKSQKRIEPKVKAITGKSLRTHIDTEHA